MDGRELEAGAKELEKESTHHPDAAQQNSIVWMNLRRFAIMVLGHPYLAHAQVTCP